MENEVLCHFLSLGTSRHELVGVGGSIFGNLEREMNYCEGAIESESDFNVQRRQSPFFGFSLLLG